MTQRSSGYADRFPLLKGHEASMALPRKGSNAILRQLDKTWRACVAACEAYRQDPSKFTGRPKLPKYQDKRKGRCLLLDDLQAMSRRALAHGVLVPAGLASEGQTAHQPVKQARSVPRMGFSGVELVSAPAEAAPSGNPALSASGDGGGDHLAALTANKQGFGPRLVTGRPIKSTHRSDNKGKAEVQEAGGTTGTPARRERFTAKGTRRIHPYLHPARQAILPLLVAEGSGTLVVGKHPGWKQEAEGGRVTHQHLVGLPPARFMAMLEYTANLAGIRCVLQEDSDTSQASALDSAAIPSYDPKQEGKHVFSGKRVKRGLYQAKDGRTLTAGCAWGRHHSQKSPPTRL